MKLLNEILIFFKNKERNFLIFFQFFNAFLSILFGKFVALHINPESFGKFNIQNAVYFFTFSLLFQPFLQYIKANYTLLRNNSAYLHIIKLYFAFLFLSTVIIILLFKFYFDESFWLILFVISTLILNSVFMLMNDYYSIKAKFIENSLLNFFKNIIPILVLLLFVFFISFTPKDGYKILWLAQIFGFIIALYYFIKWRPFIGIDRPKIKMNHSFNDIFKYITPLIFLSFWNWVNSFGDRFIIEKNLGLEVLGVYNANIGLGSKVFLMLNPLFLTLLTPIVFDSKIGVQSKKKKIDFYLKIYFLLILCSGIFVYIFQEFIGNLFLSFAYKEGFYLIFWSCISYGIITAGYLLEMLFYANNKTKIILYANIISAIVVVSVDLIFIPKFGLPIAAFALIIASIVKFLYLRFIFIITS